MKFSIKTHRLSNPGLFTVFMACMSLHVFVSSSQGAGLLKVAGESLQELEIQNHQVQVSIYNGFAQTKVVQTFFNPNSQPCEAIYVLPLPKHASLSEMEIVAGDEVLRGEVVKKQKAQEIYQQEKESGNQAGLAKKSGYQRFEFRVASVPAQGDVEVTTVYYQPVKLDTGIARYVYPLEEGGTDEVAASFWLQNDIVKEHFSIDVNITSAWPVAAVRVPHYSGTEGVDDLGNLTYHFNSQGGTLNQDFVLYYQLQDNLPGRVEMIPYKRSADQAGTFMMVVTPGVDLKPLDQGADYVFVLDISGSMQGKLHTLVEGVKKTIMSFRPQDRFRIVLFNNHAQELTQDWLPASQDQVQYALGLLDQIEDSGGTNLYAGLKVALSNVDDDRVTSFIVVTDGVTNTGTLDPRAFAEMMQTKDVRVFGFLMGNSSNWSLMDQICTVSGGFYQSVSNSDDIIGQILLAKSKVLFESMHDVEVNIKGVKTYDLSRFQFKKVFRGEQLLIIGRYAKAGAAEFEMTCKISGEEKVYRTTFNFPEQNLDNPELERIWALSKIEQIEWLKDLGLKNEGESEDAIQDLGVNYQIVTDYTSMVVLSDEGFQRHGIARRNADRITEERAAQGQRQQLPAKNYRVDQNQNAFQQSAPRVPSGGSGGGAIHPFSLLLLIGLPLIKRFRKSND